MRDSNCAVTTSRRDLRGAKSCRVVGLSYPSCRHSRPGRKSWSNHTEAISYALELYNCLKATESAIPGLRRSVTETIVQLLYPMTPHICEEIWEMLGHPPSLQNVPWPEFDEAAAQAEEIEVVFQVNGKVRGKAMMPADSDDDSLKAAALANPGVERQLEGKAPRKVIVVKGRLVNVVA